MRETQFHRVATPGMEAAGRKYDHITIQNGWLKVSVHSVGVDDEEIDAFELPSNPQLLRELASKLRDTADEIEKWRKAQRMPV